MNKVKTIGWSDGVLMTATLILLAILFSTITRDRTPYKFNFGDKIIFRDMNLKGVIKTTGRKEVRVITEYGTDIFVPVDFITYNPLTDLKSDVNSNPNSNSVTR